MQKPALLFTAVLLTACSDRAPGPEQTENATSQFLSMHEAWMDPCRIVLTPLEPTEQNDTITRHQQAVLRNYLPRPNLEKLGWAYVSKARGEFDPGYYKLAEQTAQCLTHKYPDSPEALLLQGHVLHNLHRFSEAEELARKLVAQRGSWFEYGLLGDALMEQGRLEAASDAYQAMMDQRPGPQAYSRAAHLRWLKGDLDGAIELMQMTVQAMGARAGEAAAWAYVRLATYVFQRGDHHSAQRLLNQALSLHENHAPALSAQGRIYLAQENTAAAVMSLTRAVRINPLPEYLWLLVEALYANQQPDQARRIAARLMKTGAIEDRRTYALYLASTRQQFDTALQLAKADFAGRQDVFSHDALAWTFLAVNRIPDALQHIQQATAEGTQDARLYFHAAVINKMAGHEKQATHWYQKAKLIEHMLLPSERASLDKEFAAYESQSLALVSRELLDQDH